MRRKSLEGIRAFLHALAAATHPERPFRAREARLVRAYRRLPGDVQQLIAGSYRQFLMARDNDERARSREVVVAEFLRGTGLTPEQLLAPSSRAEAHAGAPPTETLTILKRRRADSQPDSTLAVATAAAPVLDVQPDAPAQLQRARRWLPYTLAAACTACVVVFLAWTQSPTPAEPEPAPTAGETFLINRTVQLEQVLLLFSHGVIDGDTTWLHVFEFNPSHAPRPAIDAIVEAEPRDLVGKSDDDIGTAEPVQDISTSGRASGGAPDRHIPARSVRRRVVPVKTRGDKSWFIKTRKEPENPRSQRGPTELLHRLSPDR